MTRLAVAAPNRASADAAIRTGAAGGSAADAAVAAMLVSMVTEPGIVSLAGGAFVTVWPAEGGGAAVTVDGYVAMPGTGGPAPGAGPPSVHDVHTRYGGGVTMSVGHGTVATPGALAALDLTVQRYGRLPWAEVVAPAHEVARDGFLLGTASGYYLPYVRDSVFGWDPETAAALRRPDGGWLESGDRMLIAGLGDTLAELARRGARSLYDGALAEALVTDMSRRGGLVTRADLAGYRPVVRPALAFESGDWSLRTNPPPAIGGPVLAAMVTLLDGSGPAELTRVQRRVLDIRRDRLDAAGDREAAARELLAEVGLSHRPGPPSTVHVSVVDADGDACAITASYGYGSGATVPGTGLWLNNSLGEHELNRGEPARPGQRLASNMAPTVGRSADGGVLAIGSPGADRITTALLQVLAAFTRTGDDLAAAIAHPRLHVHHLPDGDGVRVEAEEDLDLPPMELPVRRHHARAMYFGGVAAALLDPVAGLVAAGDPRRDGAVAVSTG